MKWSRLKKVLIGLAIVLILGILANLGVLADIGLIPSATPAATPDGVEMTEFRSRNSKTYDLGDNRYALDASIGSVHYQDELGDWQEIDNQWSEAQAPWDWEMLEDGYHTSVLEDFTAGQILLFESQGEDITFQPMALEWTNDLDQIDQISMPQSVVADVSNTPVELLPGMEGSVGKIRWDNGYGTGRHFEWENQPARLSKLLILDSSLPSPPQFIIDGGDPVLRLNFIFAPSPALEIYIDEVLWDKKSRKQSFSTIEFKKGDEVIWGFMPAAHWDSAENGDVGLTELRKVGVALYVSVRVPYEWLQTVIYPVYIDPTLDLQVGANLDDVTEIESSGQVIDHATSTYHRSNASDSLRYWAGHRFVSGSLPELDDTINVAYVQLYVANTAADDINGNWHFEKAASPVQFVVSDYNITNRTRTDDSTSWVEDFLGVGWAQSPTLVDALQEIVDNYSPTALALIFRPNQDAGRSCSCTAHNNDPDEAAKLHIEWTAAGAGHSYGTIIG